MFDRFALVKVTYPGTEHGSITWYGRVVFDYGECCDVLSCATGKMVFAVDKKYIEGNG